MRDSVAALVDQANASMTLFQQFQMEMWTFNNSTSQTRLQAMTPTLSHQVGRAEHRYCLCLPKPGRQPDRFERAITKMNATIPASGTGVTAASPIRFLFLVTDGVEDTSGSITNQSSGFQLSGTRFIGPLSPSTCNALKNNNVRIGIVYTQYLPLYTNDFYNSYVKPFKSKIGPMLKACASDGLYFPVSSGGDITSAMLQLFSTAVASVRISN